MSKKGTLNGDGRGRRRCCRGSGKWIWVGLVVVVAGVLIAKNAKKTGGVTSTENLTPVNTAPIVVSTGDDAAAGPKLPRLVDLGAGKCIPCKMMAPILDDLKKSYAKKLEVQFIDVWENPNEAKVYEIKMIPTQVFFGADGKELGRHEGFISREDILEKWASFGVSLEAQAKLE